MNTPRWKRKITLTKKPTLFHVPPSPRIQTFEGEYLVLTSSCWDGEAFRMLHFLYYLQGLYYIWGHCDGQVTGELTVLLAVEAGQVNQFSHSQVMSWVSERAADSSRMSQRVLLQDGLWSLLLHSRILGHLLKWSVLVLFQICPIAFGSTSCRGQKYKLRGREQFSRFQGVKRACFILNHL